MVVKSGDLMERRGSGGGCMVLGDWHRRAWHGLQVNVFKKKIFRIGVFSEGDGEYIELDTGMTRVIEKPALRAPEEMIDLPAVYALFRRTVCVRAAAFDFNDVNCIFLSGDEINFVATMTPVAVEYLEAVGGQPFRGQLFSFLTRSDMWHHPCNL